VIAPAYDPKAAAMLHLQRALELVEQAQHTLEQACSEVSPLIGQVKQWQQLSALADRVKTIWYRLDAVRTSPTASLAVDDVSEPGERARWDALFGEGSHAPKAGIP
jgi:ABC-type uncharacterized transport system fused permease/ATPase subunit